MKKLLIFLICVLPLKVLSDKVDESNIPKDNSHYVEGKTRLVWMPNDENGKPQLVELWSLNNKSDPCLNAVSPGLLNSYRLYTRCKDSQILQHGYETSLKHSKYNGSKPLNVIVHGWQSFANSAGCKQIRKAFLKAKDCNVISLDWSFDAQRSYRCAAESVPYVAKRLASFINWVFKKRGGNKNQLHMVGFGLGAHVVGEAGEELHINYKKLPTRITGLDPAGDLFFPKKGLHSSHGRYVEVIHTDDAGAGLDKVIGHADFYPNGGRSQPGCKGKKGCSHLRAYFLFAATVSFERILYGRLCDGIVEAKLSKCKGKKLRMGTDLMKKKGEGLYGLKTKSKWPFDKCSDDCEDTATFSC